MMRMRILPVLGFSILFGWAEAAPLQACEAAGFVNNAGRALMSAARARSAPAFSSVASHYTDLRSIALFALGPHRNLVGPAEEAKYVALTRAFIGRTLADNAERLLGRSLEITSCDGPTSAMTVNARLSGGTKVVFKLYRSRRGFLVRDVNISSVWLAQQLRSTFSGVIRRNNGDINALYDFLSG